MIATEKQRTRRQGLTWYYARLRWAVIVGGWGLREWKESTIMIRAAGRKAALERA